MFVSVCVHIYLCVCVVMVVAPLHRQDLPKRGKGDSPALEWEAGLS